MIRQLLLIALLVAGFWLYRRLKQRLAPAKSNNRPYQEMVRCDHCGIYIPRAQAIGRPGQGHFCSEEHRLAEHDNKPG